ncbi:hypothetical protein LINGRAHAP2_LOCUS12410 [Linum grandiflorum]
MNRGLILSHSRFQVVYDISLIELEKVS